jgi:hypothetical protein
MTTQQVLMLPGTAVVFKDSDATYTLATNGLANAEGTVSDQWDRGAGAKPMTYRVRCSFQIDGAHTGVVGEFAEYYLITSDGTTQDGTIGTSSTALTVEKKRNLKLIGNVQIDVAAVDTAFTKTFTIEILDRYVSFGVWNATTDHFAAHNDVSFISVTPYSDEIQAAA